MRKIVKEAAWFTYKHPILSATMLLISGLLFSMGLAMLIASWLNPDPAIISIETVKILAKTGLSFILVAIVLMIGYCYKIEWQKIPKIAKDKAQKILKENPQLNPPMNNHAQLIKWLELYENFSSAKADLMRITKQLNKVSEFEKNKEKLEAKIKNLKLRL